MESNLKRGIGNNTNVIHISLKIRNYPSLDSILPPTRMDFYNSALLIVTSMRDSEERLSGKQKLVGILPCYINFISAGPPISTSSVFFSSCRRGRLKSFLQKAPFVLSTSACKKAVLSAETRSFLHLYKRPQKALNVC